MSISKSVGRNCANLRADVLKVQELLNTSRTNYPRLGVAIKPLIVDGDCGSLTVGAIESFQYVVMQFQTADGIVEPNRNTWKRLNGNTGTKKELAGNISLQRPAVENFIQWFIGQPTSNLASLHKSYREENDRILGIKKPLITTIEDRKVTSFSQTDNRWGSSTLGNGKGASATLKASGCALVSLTMAATYLGAVTSHWPKNIKPSQLDPTKVNSIFKKAGVFTKNSYSLFIAGGAKALGMKGVDSGRGQKLTSSHLQIIDNCLRQGGLVMLHVDYKKDSEGDHWVLLTQKNATGEYTAIDPAYGKEIIFAKTPETGSAIKNVLLYGKVQKGAKNVGGYKVVRYVTLTSL